MATGGLGTYLKNKVLNAALNGTGAAYTGTATVDVALLTTAATAPDGTGAVEATTGNYPSYARVQVTCNTSNFPASTAGSISDGVAISFPTPTGSPTAVIVGWAIYEHGNSNLLFWGKTATSQTINAGGAVSIAISALTLAINDTP